MAQELAKRGYERVFALKGGWAAWVKAGYPVETKPSAQGGRSG